MNEKRVAYVQVVFTGRAGRSPRFKVKLLLCSFC